MIQNSISTTAAITTTTMMSTTTNTTTAATTTSSSLSHQQSHGVEPLQPSSSSSRQKPLLLTLHTNHVKYGSLLGHGGFSNVYSVQISCDRAHPPPAAVTAANEEEDDMETATTPTTTLATTNALVPCPCSPPTKLLSSPDNSYHNKPVRNLPTKQQREEQQEEAEATHPTTTTTTTQDRQVQQESKIGTLSSPPPPDSAITMMKGDELTSLSHHSSTATTTSSSSSSTNTESLAPLGSFFSTLPPQPRPSSSRSRKKKQGDKKKQQQQRQEDDDDPDDDKEEDPHYALKQLHKETLQCPEKTLVAMHDLRQEVRLLTQLPYHPHIVQLIGISSNFWNDNNNNNHDNNEEEEEEATSGGQSSSSNVTSLASTMFLIQEKLVESLEQTLQRWKIQAKQNSGIRRGVSILWQQYRSSSSSSQTSGTTTTTGTTTTVVPPHYLSHASQCERIEKVAMGIASAMSFLHHEHGIMFRDLKPANVGIDIHGQVRLFDFGLATHVVVASSGCNNHHHHHHKKKKKENSRKNNNNKNITELSSSSSPPLPPSSSSSRLSLYRIPGGHQVGTLRYMAPEVAMSQSYSFSADVYSFGLVLWQICTLQLPYGPRCDNLSHFSLSLQVMQKDKIPYIHESNIPCRILQDLLHTCWSEPASSRPTFHYDIIPCLDCILQKERERQQQQQQQQVKQQQQQEQHAKNKNMKTKSHPRRWGNKKKNMSI